MQLIQFCAILHVNKNLDPAFHYICYMNLKETSFNSRRVELIYYKNDQSLQICKLAYI